MKRRFAALAILTPLGLLPSASSFAETISEFQVPIAVVAFGPGFNYTFRAECGIPGSPTTTTIAETTDGVRASMEIVATQVVPGVRSVVCTFSASVVAAADNDHPCVSRLGPDFGPTVGLDVGVGDRLAVWRDLGLHRASLVSVPVANSVTLYARARYSSFGPCRLEVIPIWNSNLRSGSVRIRPDSVVSAQGVRWQALRSCESTSGPPTIVEEGVATGSYGGIGELAGLSRNTAQRCRVTLNADRTFFGAVRLSAAGLPITLIKVSPKTYQSDWTLPLEGSASFDIYSGVAPPAPAIELIGPSRVVDTRGGRPVQAGVPTRFDVRNLAHLGVDVRAVLVTLTAIDPDGDTWISITADGNASSVLTSTLNVHGGVTRANTALVRLTDDGSVFVFSALAATHVALDVVGLVRDTSVTSVVAPVRVVDTRRGTFDIRLEPGRWVPVDIRALGALPDNTKWVFANVTTTGQSAVSYLSMSSVQTDDPPATSSLNWQPGEDSSTFMLIELDARGRAWIYNHSGRADLIVDLLAFAPTTVDIVGIKPTRTVDTRLYWWRAIGDLTNVGPMTDGTGAEVPVAAVAASIPARGVAAVVITLTAADTQIEGYFTAYQCGQDRPLVASHLNTTRNGAVANTVFVTPPNTAPGLSVLSCVVAYQSGGSTNLIVDISSFFTM